MNGEYEIDKQTYKSMKPEDRDWIMFKTFNKYRVSSDQRFCDIEEEQADLRKKVSLWKKVHTVASTGAGVIGGFLAVIIRGLFKPVP